MASLTKTFSGDLTTFLAGKIWDKIKEVNDDDRLKKASPEVKKAAKELDKEDPNDVSIPVKDKSLRDLVSKLFGAGLDSRMMIAEAKIDKLATGIKDVGAGIADTQKLIINQNEIIEDKFDDILEIFGVQKKEREKEKERINVEKEELGLEEGEFSASTRALLKSLRAGKVGGMGILGWLLKRQGAKLLTHLTRRLIPRSIRARMRLIRGLPNAYKRKALQSIARRLPSGVAKLLTRESGEFLTKQVTKKVAQRQLTKTGTRVGGKFLSKKIPLGAWIPGTIFAIERALKGDAEGAFLEFASGVLGSFPGKGTAASVAIDTYLFGRDVNKGEYEEGTGKTRTKSGVGEFHGTELKIPGGKVDSILDDYKAQLQYAGTQIVSTSVAVGKNLGIESDIRNKINTDNIVFPIEPISYTSDLGRVGMITSGVDAASEQSVIPSANIFGELKSNIQDRTRTTENTSVDGDSSTKNDIAHHTGSSGVRIDASGESGVDFTPNGPNNRAVFSGVVTEIGHQYNPNKIGGDDRQGAGYGNYVVVTSTDPVNGKKFDGLYAHFPKDSIVVSEGDQVEYGDILGPMATAADYADPVTRREVGSGTGPHTSLDFLVPGTATPYPEWRTNIVPRVDTSFDIKPPGKLPDISQIDSTDTEVITPPTGQEIALGDTEEIVPFEIEPPSNVTNNVEQITDGSMFVKQLIDTAISRTKTPITIIKNNNVDVDRTIISRTSGDNNDDWIDTYRTLSLVS